MGMMGLEISGNNMANMPSRPAGPKMQVGERLSMCGQFVINGRGTFEHGAKEMAVYAISINSFIYFPPTPSRPSGLIVLPQHVLL